MADNSGKTGLLARWFGRGTGKPTAPEAPVEGAGAAMPASGTTPVRAGWWQRLKSGLSRSSSALTEGITTLFSKRKLDAATLEELEDLLIQSDLGVDMAARVIGAIAKGRYGKDLVADDIRAILAEEVARTLGAVARPLVVDATRKPFVILVVGVNGSGKTTTIGKLAAKYRSDGHKVMLAAGDTFRAAAIEQLRVGGERTGAGVFHREQGSDAASLVFEAMGEARAQAADVLIIDTAGRLQNKAALMEELGKIRRVIQRHDPTAPHACLIVLDATVGQNALSQVEAFNKTAGATGLVMTKLDGTARGGILVALAERFALPIHFIGVGEAVEDLEPFTAEDFARAIVGLDAR
jgi:fused signal recognition particle receptor